MDWIMSALESKATSAPARSRRFFEMLPTMSVGQMLGVLVLATAAPLLALAFIMVQQLVRTERQSVRGELLSSMRTLSALVENEIGRHIAVAATLATSQALEKGDLETFRLQAEQALKIVPGAWLSLSDPSGRFVMSTLLDKGEPLPLRGNLDVMAKAWATGKPQVSDVVAGPISKRQNAFVEYPVFKGGEPLYSIVVGLNPDRFLNLLKDKFDQR